MSMLRYIELKSGFHDNGPAWIGRVALSRSRTTVYFNGRALKRAKGGGISGNYFDIESGEQYSISGIKRNGEDRHWAGSGPILVEASAVDEYLAVSYHHSTRLATKLPTRSSKPTSRSSARSRTVASRAN